MNKAPLLSIAIPAYDRPNELLYCIKSFVSQIKGRFEDCIEIIISDDHTPSVHMEKVRNYANNYSFIKYRRYPNNIGLERNLIECSHGTIGEYLWIFGDDDFLETDDSLSIIMEFLKKGAYDFYILNRTRRNFALSTIISDNWMKLSTDTNESFLGLREFCIKYGFISIIGFISVNIFRRKLFHKIEYKKYFGTFYPQLGTMLEAFHDRKTLLIGEPLICHRTQTAEEKKAVLGEKKTESDFMADVKLRNATYFSHPYVSMLKTLIELGAFTPADILNIPENTVIKGPLIDFLIQTVTQSSEMKLDTRPESWERTASFFHSLPLDTERKQQINSVLLNHISTPTINPLETNTTNPINNIFTMRNQKTTISVITPSYNQAEFLGECLASVRNQTYPPIEHFVFDPGSKDNSRAIAASFPHVTLIAEPDKGQSDALNKGFKKAKGDIIAWLNSDDSYANNKIFERIVQRFNEPDAPDIIYGKGIFIDEKGEKLRDVYVNKNPDTLPTRFQHEDGILQPALFMKRSVIEKVGTLRNDRHYSMDYEYWIRCVKSGIKFAFVNEQFAIARYHIDNKTYGMRGNSYAEVCDMMKEHFNYVNHIWLMRYAEFLTEGHDGVLASSVNKGVKDNNKLDRIYRDLLISYNCSYDTYNKLIKHSGQKGYGDTLREMKNLGVAPQTPCKVIPLDKDYEPGSASYTVGKRRWAFEHKWKSNQITKTHQFLRKQIKERRRDTCVIVGNGPSLNKTDLSLLKNQDVIVSNNVFLSQEVMEYATYYTVVNYFVAEQSSHHINQLKRIHKILPYWLSYCLNPGENSYFIDAVGYPEFSKDIFKNMSWRHTVTFFNLHLAYGLGYQKVILIGFDHNYIQPKGVIESEVIKSFAADQNHFHESYFLGKEWQAADVDMMEEMYRLAKTAFKEDGREIINSTVGGKLELFSRIPLEKALIPNSKKQCEIMDQSSESVSHPESAFLVGPFNQEECSHWDETDGVAHLFSGTLSGSTMIDVGAHHGWALTPFLNKGWEIFAFEPDEKNRQILLNRLKTHKNGAFVKLDHRAVCDKIHIGLPFYSSKESTGVSGLSAFLPSHQTNHTVDTVTLTKALVNKTITTVDFLKIDTEGHDLFVLKGFPWERFKPAVIECEFEDTKTIPLGYTVHDMAGFLIDKGYQVFVSEWHPIVRYGIRHNWKSLICYPCQITNEKGWGNLLAFRDPIADAAIVSAVKKNLKFYGVDESITKTKPEVQVDSVNSSLQFGSIIYNGNVSLNNGKYKILPPTDHNWVAFQYNKNVQSGDTISSDLNFYVDRDCTLEVKICRHGTTPFESSTKTFPMSKGQHALKIFHIFKKTHKGIRIQIGSADKQVTISNINSQLKSGLSKLADLPSAMHDDVNKPVAKPKDRLSSIIPDAKKCRLDTVDHNSLYVVGNGASLRNFEFKKLKAIKHIGMNAAYRHWQNIGIYPDYYICLDTVVIESLKDEIYELIQNRVENNIQLFFLRRDILNFYPELKTIPGILFYEDYLNSPYFEGINSGITTGSFAALLGAMLGYKQIHLLGIDLNYVQQIPEAKNIKGNVLEITQTPVNNPNYFFDDYQRKGDLFNIPDSKPDLHYNSWTMVKKRLKDFGVHVRNCNPDSKLDIFDYEDINKVLSS